MRGLSPEAMALGEQTSTNVVPYSRLAIRRGISLAPPPADSR
jgi:hypothetical protein